MAETSTKASTVIKQQTTDYKGLVVGLSGVATASFSLYNAYDDVADGTVAVSKANLAAKIYNECR